MASRKVPDFLRNHFQAANAGTFRLEFRIFTRTIANIWESRMTIHNPLIASDRVEGTKVVNSDDKDMGTIHSLMIDKQSGRVAFAIMSFGGILGVGLKYHPIPWALLDYEPGIGGYRVDLDEMALEAAPAYAPEDVDGLALEGGTASVDRHYAASVEKRTLADYRGPKFAGDPRAVTTASRPAQPGMASPEAAHDELVIDRNRGIDGKSLDEDPLERDRLRS
jgi:hypothetical protein